MNQYSSLSFNDEPSSPKSNKHKNPYIHKKNKAAIKSQIQVVTNYADIENAEKEIKSAEMKGQRRTTNRNMEQSVEKTNKLIASKSNILSYK